MLINAAIGKANVYHVAFLLIAYSYFLGLFFLTAAKGKMPFISAVLLAMPIYGFEIAWISSADYAKALIASYGKLIRPNHKRN